MATLTGLRGMVILHVSLSSNTVACGHKEARAEETEDPAPGCP